MFWGEDGFTVLPPINCTCIMKPQIQVLQMMDVKKLSLNIGKTNFIIFKSSQHPLAEAVSIEVGNYPIRKTCYVKFLGVLLDEYLSWKYHLTELSKNLLGPVVCSSK